MREAIEQGLTREGFVSRLRSLGIPLAGLALSTVIVAVLEAPPIAISDASLVYLVAVVVAGTAGGTWPAMATAVGAFLVYDLLFIEPRFTLTVEDPKEWLELALFLFVAVAIGRLTALQRERADEGARRARESQALFAISRLLATTPSLEEAGPAIVERLARDADMDRIWIGLDHQGSERIIADSASGPLPTGRAVWSLSRTPGEVPAEWVRLHVGQPGIPAPAATDTVPFRVRIESEGQPLGNLWGSRERSAPLPAREHTRLLALGADQIALALRREQLAREATEAEITRRSEALKSALLDSVSHDFRTPLASIRATGGSLADTAVRWTADGLREAGLSVEAEVDRLSRFVTNLLDASRIEAGSVQPELELFDLPELIEPVLDRLRPRLDGRPISLHVEDGLPPVRVDPVLFDQVLSNLLENAERHTPAGTAIRVAVRPGDPGWVEMVVEDEGSGIPDAALPRLFDRFYRLSQRPEGARRGLGLGLSVVRGLVEAMGGQARASRSELGGLAVHISLASAPPPPDSEANG